MFVFGGHNGLGSALGDFYGLDPDYGFGKGSWGNYTNYGTPPIKRYEHSASGLNGKMYIIGGSTYGSRNELHAFDPVIWPYYWQELSPAPVDLRWHTSSVIQDHLFVLADTGFYSYDPASDQWTLLTPAGSPPSFLREHTAVVINNKIYVFGGGQSSFSNDLYEYTP